MAQSRLLVRCGRLFVSDKVDRVIARNLSLTSLCSLKSNLPITWTRPEKIPCIHPTMSGDLEPVMKLDLKTTPPLEFQNSEELATADEIVRKLFTLEYYPHNKTKEVLREKYMSSVRRHGLDDNSHEARISRFTANIRAMQLLIEKHPRNKIMKARLKEKIDKRRRLLLELREQDYKCFEYLLEKLNLEYKPFPPKTVYMRVERKRSLRMLTTEYCDKIVESKLADYRKQLDSRKIAFLEGKLDSYKWIAKTEAECGVAPTVSEADIAQIQKQLEDLKTDSTESSDK